MNQHASAGRAMTVAVVELVTNRADFNYFTYTCEKLGFIYFSCPAVANVRTTGSLNLAVAKALGLSYQITELKHATLPKYGVLERPKDHGSERFGQLLDDPRVLKFTFLRDPIERFAAIYRSNFAPENKRNKLRIKLFAHLGIPEEEPLTMLDLAELLCEEAALKNFSPHLRLQRRMTAFDLVNYDFIGRHENWNTDYPALSHEIFGPGAEQFEPIKRFNADPEGQKVRVLVDAETQAALRHAYKEDYEMLEEVAELYPNGFAQ